MPAPVDSAVYTTASNCSLVVEFSGWATGKAAAAPSQSHQLGQSWSCRNQPPDTWDTSRKCYSCRLPAGIMLSAWKAYRPHSHLNRHESFSSGFVALVRDPACSDLGLQDPVPARPFHQRFINWSGKELRSQAKPLSSPNNLWASHQGCAAPSPTKVSGLHRMVHLRSLG